jgi:hypothetical protein
VPARLAGICGFALSALLTAPAAAQPAKRPAPAPARTAPGKASAPKPPAHPAVPGAPAPEAAAPGVEPDISLTVNVHIKEMKFERVPKVDVKFSGRPLRDTVWKIETNLPKEIQPGVVYRDVEVRLILRTTFEEARGLVAALSGRGLAAGTTAPAGPPPASTGPAEKGTP